MFFWVHMCRSLLPKDRILLCEKLGVHHKLPPERVDRIGKSQPHHQQAARTETNSVFPCISPRNTFLWAE